MTGKRIAPESQYDRSTLTNATVRVTPGLLRWWDRLSQRLKILYCELHPNSDLTRGHLGQLVFDGWDEAQMRRYHQQQADDLKLSLMGAVDLEGIAKLDQLYRLQLRLAGR